MLSAHDEQEAPKTLVQRVRENSSHTWWFGSLLLAGLNPSNQFTSDLCPIVEVTIDGGMRELTKYIYGDTPIADVSADTFTTLKECISKMQTDQQYLIIFMHCWLRAATQSKDVATIGEFAKQSLKSTCLENCIDLVDMQCKLRILNLENDSGFIFLDIPEVVAYLKTHRDPFIKRPFMQTKSFTIYTLLKERKFAEAVREIANQQLKLEEELKKRFPRLVLPNQNGSEKYTTREFPNIAPVAK